MVCNRSTVASFDEKVRSITMSQKPNWPARASRSMVNASLTSPAVVWSMAPVRRGRTLDLRCLRSGSGLTRAPLVRAAAIGARGLIT